MLFGQSGEDFQFEIIEEGESRTITITLYTGSLTEVLIPEEIDGLPVTAIGDLAFSAFDGETKTFTGMGLSQVTIANTVTSIGNYAFYQNNLVALELPAGVSAIGEAAFAGNQLTSLVIPEGLKSLGVEAFARNHLSGVSLPSSLTSISGEAFTENKLTSVDIPGGVTSIGNYAFSWNQLTGLVIPEGVKVIGEGAFAGNALTDISIPDSVTDIGSGAFAQNKLVSVRLSENMKSIADAVFAKNELDAILIPAGVETIGANAFSGNKITEVVIPDSVKAIGEKAFFFNPLTGVTLGSNVSLENDAFGSGFPAFYTRYDKSAEVYTFKNGRWNYGSVPFELDFIRQGNSLTLTIAGYTGTGTDVQIPGKIKDIPVTAIADNAFAGNRLTGVSIPAGVKTIGDNAFEGNPLRHVTIGFGANLSDSSFGTAFYRYYYNNGQKAGLYIYEEEAWSSDFR
jgi:hypothetical protein